MALTVSHLLKTIKQSEWERLDHILIHPCDFIKMMRNDDLRDVIKDHVAEWSKSDSDILDKSLSIHGVPIHISNHIEHDSIVKVFGSLRMSYGGLKKGRK